MTQGCGTGTFCPERLATRYEAAALVLRGSGLPAWTGASRFTDVSDAQKGAVDGLAEACVVAGCATDRFCPDDEITREQVAKLIAVAFSVGPYAPCVAVDTDVPPDTDVIDTDIPPDTDVSDTDVAPDTDVRDSDGADTDQTSAPGTRVRPPGGCGCDHAGADGVIGAVWAAGLALARRRGRRRADPHSGV